MKTEKIKSNGRRKSISRKLVGLTVKEVQELADFLKSEYGIEPAAVAVAAPAGGGGRCCC